MSRHAPGRKLPEGWTLGRVGVRLLPAASPSNALHFVKDGLGLRLVSPLHGGEYALTHIATGRALLIVRGFAQAFLLALDVAAAFDWSQPLADDYSRYASWMALQVTMRRRNWCFDQTDKRLARRCCCRLGWVCP